MPKLTNPLFSFNARGTLAKALTFRRRGKDTIAEKTPTHTDKPSEPQLYQRVMYQQCTALWHTLTPTEQQAWETQARRKKITGYNYFLSLCLAPNPGIYLPLSGGTMKGDIDMASNKILALPPPTLDTEADTKGARNSAISLHAALTSGVHSFGKTSRVTHSASQTVPNSTWTTLSFDTERWDTDSIHHLTINNTRLTCKTPGLYIIIANARFASNPTGDRYAAISSNSLSGPARNSLPGLSTLPSILNVTTLLNLSLNEYVNLRVWQNSGSPLNIEKVPNYSPEFMMSRIA